MLIFFLSGTGWVAWMRDSFSEDYVELTFYFDSVRIFDAVHIYTNNYFKRDVQVNISRLKIFCRSFNAVACCSQKVIFIISFVLWYTGKYTMSKNERYILTICTYMIHEKYSFHCYIFFFKLDFLLFNTAYALNFLSFIFFFYWKNGMPWASKDTKTLLEICRFEKTVLYEIKYLQRRFSSGCVFVCTKAI